MDSSLQTINTESCAVRGFNLNDEQSGVILNDDQTFILYFIMGTYFGPHLKGEMPQMSVLQRVAERLPPYSLDQLGGSHINAVEIEGVYYHMLRKAHRSVVVDLCLLRQFIQGKVVTQGQDPDVSYPQFPDLFPPKLHPLSHFDNQSGIIQNVVFIKDPKIPHATAEEIGRFQRLTGLDSFGEIPSLSRKMPSSLTEDDSNPLNQASPAMIFLPSQPTKKEWSDIITVTKGFGLTGSAVVGKFGSMIRLVDIGESEDSFIFHVSLPGVKRDEREFSCEVENKGKVVIRGVTTTGEKTVYKYSQAFEMQSQNLCPAGYFSISFQLPGPVNPQLFSGNFGMDGILEGIVMKKKLTH